MSTYQQAKDAKAFFNLAYRQPQMVGVVMEESGVFYLRVLSYDVNFDPRSLPAIIDGVKVIASISPLAPKSTGCGKKPT